MLPPSRPTRALLVGLTMAGIMLAGCTKKPQTWNPTPPYAPATGKDFDLTWPKPGANGSPDDPEWAPQQQTPTNLPPVKDSACDKSKKEPYDSQCSDQSGKLVEDTGTGLIGLACTLFGDPSAINGHVDWTVASAHGSLGFLNFADDWDYNLLLLPDSDAGLTGNNNALGNPTQRYIEVEFDSRELEDRFQTNWWREFASLARKGVQEGDFKVVDEHMHSGSGYAYGSIYGLFGLDCEHGCRSEFHPAYAVAIQVQESKDNNLWAIFARNSGDEGFCSHLDHRLDLGGQAMQVLLPYKSSKLPTAINIQEFATSEKQPGADQWCPRFTFSPNQGEVIEIPLPPPDAKGLTEVVVQFTWPDDATPMPSKGIDRTMARQTIAKERTARLSVQTGEVSAEERIGEIYRTLNPERKSMPAMEFRRKVLTDYRSTRAAKQLTKQKGSVYDQQNTPLKCAAPETSKLTMERAVQPTPAPAKRVALPSHVEKDEWDKATIASVCAAYKNYNNSENKLPAETVQKLEKLCSDKRL